MKVKFNQTAVKPAMLYAVEYWAIKNQNENKVIVANIRMLHWMCDYIRKSVRITPIIKKMVENRFRWFRLVER